MTAQDWWMVIAAVAGALGLKEILQIIVKFWTGRASRQRAELDRIAKERDKARERADTEASKRRRLEESLSEHRTLMFAAECIDRKDIPSWPY